MFLSTLFRNFKKQSLPSKINGTVKVGSSFGKKALIAAGIPQSGGEFEMMWKTVLKKLDKSFAPKSCLMLGVAGGTALNLLQKKYPKIYITGIELDPVILKVAKENGFFKTNERTKLVVADAIKWVKKDKKKYDLVIVDLYIGDQNPTPARQKPFLLQVEKLLNKKGVVLYNCHYSDRKEAEYKSFRKLTNGIFPEITELFTFPKNKILKLENEYV